MTRVAIGQGISYAAILFWVNAYVCRNWLFHPTAWMNSLHGYWAALARLGEGWLQPSWWPYWDFGIPFEFTSAPLVPGLAALFAGASRVPHLMAVEWVSALFYCAAPVALFLLAWLLTRAPHASFFAGVFYSLLSPAQLLAPDGPVSWQQFRGPHRLMLQSIWDETPRCAALTFLLIFTLFLARSLERRRLRDAAASAVFLALAMVASPFALVSAGLIVLCLMTAFPHQDRRAGLFRTGAIVLLGCALAARFLPPSLWVSIAAASAAHESWTLGAWKMVAAAAVLWLVLIRVLRRATRDWRIHFFALLAFAMGCAPVLLTWFDRLILPQAHRFRIEMEAAVALAVVFGIRPALQRLPRWANAGLAVLLLWPAAAQVIHHRRLAKDALYPADVTRTIEYRVAQRVARDLPGQRVFLPGSIAHWANSFAPITQFTGSEGTQAYSQLQQSAMTGVYEGGQPSHSDARASLAWLKAYGAAAVVVPGPDSQEHWKPFAHPEQFATLLQPLWSEDGVTVYRVPQRTASLAHVIPETALLARPPGADTTPLDRYNAALDDPALPEAAFEWQGRNRARIAAVTAPGQAIAIQVSHHAGWHALLDGQPTPIYRDALGLMWVRPAKPGPALLELSYDGGWELRLCAALSVLSLLAIAYCFAGGTIHLNSPVRTRTLSFPSLPGDDWYTTPVVRAAAYMAILAGINFYICRGLFSVEFTAHTNSIQGLWISMARLAGEHWFRPSWWPYQDGGMPFEHTYMPLVPAATALLSKAALLAPGHAFHIVMGLVLCLGPVTLFLLLWRISRAPGCAFWVSLAYSLTSPARALLPEPDINPVRYWSSLRIYTSIVWDDLPHETAVCFFPLALLFLWRSLEKRRPRDLVLTVVFMALTVLPSVFGATALFLGAAAMLLAVPKESLRRDFLLLAVLAFLAYLIVSPFLPPSMIAIIRFNQQHFIEDRWSAGSFTALGLVLCGAFLLRRELHRRSARPHIRFFVLFAWIAGSIPLIDAHLQRHFLPQPNRYHPELEMGIAMLALPAIAWAAARIPRNLRIALAAFVLLVAAEHAVGLRRFTAEATRPVDLRQRIESRIAGWMDQHLPGQRVMVPGSIAQWFNVFSDTPQLSGSSYSTTPNWNQQDAMKSILTSTSPEDTAAAVLWLKAFGVHAATIAGPRSPEFWKGPGSNRFDGLLPILWRQEDTTIYRVPQRSPSLAHVVPAGAAALDNSLGELRKYVAALEDPGLPLAESRWEGFRGMTIAANLAAGQSVSVQTGYHRGWHARANGRFAPIRRDGLGFLLIDPDCQGPCRIQLTYDGGWEYLLCRGASMLTLLALSWFSLKWRMGVPR